MVASWEIVGYCGGRMPDPGGRAPPTQPPGFELLSCERDPLRFRGTFEHALDAKNRLTVPAKFRAALSNGVVLAASPETNADTPRSIAIWTPEAYDAYASATLAGMSPMSPKARELERFFSNQSYDTELDSAHRVMIPTFLRDYAGLGQKVVVTGSGQCLEVWPADAYARYRDGVLIRIPEIAASLGDTA
jgi:MraZ protein